MRTGTRLLLVVAVTGALSACDSGNAPGFDSLTVADLDAQPQPGHFRAAPRRVDARLRADDRGCLTVRVDGVDRYPIWPAATRVEESAGSLGRYVVRIPGGPVLDASVSAGSRFEAEGVVDAEGRAFIPESEVGSHLGFCGVRAAPIAFRDAGTFRLRGT